MTIQQPVVRVVSSLFCGLEICRLSTLAGVGFIALSNCSIKRSV
jgi:hypothetical protein